VERGHEVTVFASDRCWKQELKVKQHQAQYVDGVQTYYFRNVSNWLIRNAKLATPYRLPAIMRREIDRFDVIHVHEHRTAFAVATHYYATRRGVPYIVQARGSVVRYLGKQMLKQMFDAVWGNQVLRDASVLIALTKEEKQQYHHIGIPYEKVEIVPNAINFSSFENLPPKGEFRKKHDLNSRDKVVLFLARIHKIKGLDLLVESFAKLVKVFKEAKLVVVGPDVGFRSTVEKQIERLGIAEYVLFTGPLYESDKIEAYVDADVYVLPSVYEIFGQSVLEACACGTPVVVTAQCGVADLVREIGLVVEYDVNQMKEALYALLSDGQLRQRLGQSGKAKVREEYDYPRIAQQVEEIYECSIGGA
jgi:glycosyltransferase involved in cell wall biosynthesis